MENAETNSRGRWCNVWIPEGEGSPDTGQKQIGGVGACLQMSSLVDEEPEVSDFTQGKRLPQLGMAYGKSSVLKQKKMPIMSGRLMPMNTPV